MKTKTNKRSNVTRKTALAIMVVLLLCINAEVNGAPGELTPTVLPGYSAAVFDDFNSLNSSLFTISDHANGGVFNCLFRPEAITFRSSKMTLTINNNPHYNNAASRLDQRPWRWGCSEIQTLSNYHYGYYEASMKPINSPGVITSLFTYTEPNDWNTSAHHNEIDIEFNGKNPRQVEFTVHMGGIAQHTYVYDLGFNASQSFHTYGFLWEPDAITWYVDGLPVHSVNSNTPADGPTYNNGGKVWIPYEPSALMMNAWVGTSAVNGWIGAFNGNVPLTAEYQWFSYEEPGQNLIVPENLIANPEVTTATGRNPEKWYQGSWGNYRATMSYDTTTGHNDNRSLYVSVTSITKGDVKWYHEAVPVISGKTYQYSDWYKSNTDTNIVVEYQSNSGSYQYQHLANVPASPNTWRYAEVSFTVPNGITKVIVYHHIDKVGWLRTDSFSLRLQGANPPVPPVPPVPDPLVSSNLIYNGDLETAIRNQPNGWQKDAWGSNTANLTYDGHAVTTTITKYRDGDAKWAFDHVPVTAGEEYIYQDDYKSNVSSRVVLEFRDRAGKFSYTELTAAPAASTMKKYITRFTVPRNATSVTVYHLLDRIGSLTIDNVSLVQVIR